jgi:hypothetical protein
VKAQPLYLQTRPPAGAKSFRHESLLANENVTKNIPPPLKIIIEICLPRFCCAVAATQQPAML